jgi:hypothetical protein
MSRILFEINTGLTGRFAKLSDLKSYTLTDDVTDWVLILSTSQNKTMKVSFNNLKKYLKKN